jgi:hypothetical protein
VLGDSAVVGEAEHVNVPRFEWAVCRRNAGRPRGGEVSDREQHDVSRLNFEECVYSTTTSGSRRRADASLVITKLEDFGEWDWPLGSLTSASISEVKSTFVRRCTSPF